MLFVQGEATAARRRFPVFLVDATTGIDVETGEAGGQTQISKNGAAFGNTTATLTAIGNGAYYVELTATELDTAGIVIVRYKSANTAEFNLHADVVAINVNDGVRAGLTALPNAAAEAAGGLYTRGTGAGQIRQVANGLIDANVMRWLDTAAATPTVAGVPEVDTTHQLGTAAPALVGGRYDASVGAMAANVLTAAATAADFSVEVNAAVLAVLGALADAAADGDPTSADTLMMYVKQLVNTHVGTVGIPTMPAAVVPGNGVSISEMIRQIYDEVANVNGATPATATAVAAVQTDVDDIQARLPAALESGRMAAQLAESQIDQIVDEVWDEPTADHVVAGSTGEALADAAAGGAAADPWTTALPGAYAAGTAGNTLGNLVNSVWAVSLASVTGAAARSPLNALRFLRNKWTVADTTLTVTTEDDVTTAWTATVTSDATAAPVVGNDPA